MEPLGTRPLAQTILAISRAYSIPYLSIAGLAAMLLSGFPLTPVAIICLLTIPACLTVGLAALNDAVHAAADARAGRGRDYAVSLLYGLGGGCTLGAVLIAAWGGPWVLAGVAGTMLGGIVYGLLKARPGLGNVVRGATTVPLVLGLGALASGDWRVWPLTLGLGVLDAAGNIYGDVRDAPYDYRAGVTTLVVLHPRLAVAVAVALHAIALAILSTTTGPWVLVTLAGSAYVLTRPPHWQHRSFLMLKYVTVIGLALAAAASPQEIALVCALAPGAVAAWVVYTIIHRPREERQYAAAD